MCHQRLLSCTISTHHSAHLSPMILGYTWKNPTLSASPWCFFPRQDEMLASHVVCSHIRSHPDANPEEKTKKPKTNKTSHLNPISHWEENMPNQLDGKKRKSLSLLLKMEPQKKTTSNLLVFGGLSKTNHENWKISLGNVIALLLSSIESFHVFVWRGNVGVITSVGGIVHCQLRF